MNFFNKPNINTIVNQIIKIDNKYFNFSGNEEDAYFKDLPAFNSGNHQLEKYLSTHLTRNAVCLDIGANIGLTTVLMANFASDGKVYSFEPSPINLKYLKMNIIQNKFNNIQVIESAVGSECGFVNFIMPSQAGANSTVARNVPLDVTFSKVPVITIDNWVKSLNLNQIDLIKIDVEGFEPNVLIGAAKTITQLKPKLYMEFNSITTIFEACLSPLVFAEALWKLFDVFTVTSEGSFFKLNSAREFTFENIMSHGCIDDILLQIKDGITYKQLVRTIPQSAPAAML